ncbi:T9SS type A sorting domain-containing protein [Chryseobacterium sp. 2R14A]|uniref:T9SS type A sorting domain-containing protein n=1 Tax=Chryseobacterium sp. 2R14A TaxID=3380353 RepID=UPI003CF8D7FD
MKKSLFSIGYPFSASSVILNGKRSRQLSLFALLLTFMLSSNLKAQGSFQILPGITNEDGAFPGPYANAPRRFQILIAHAPISLMTNKYITSISFSLQGSYTNAWPLTDTTFGSYEIYLSKGVTPPNIQMNFAANIVGTQTMVKSGSLIIPAGSVPAGNSSNPYAYTLVFDTPYLYTGGNLVIEIRHTGHNNPVDVPVRTIDTNTMVNTTYLSACWQQGNGITKFNFPFIRINSVQSLEGLGVKSVTIDDGFSVYPNPVKDYLYVKGDKEITEFNVFNAAGQKILSQKNNANVPKLGTFSLSKGVYFLQMIDKQGNSTSTKFVKE